jgi:separase
VAGQDPDKKALLAELATSDLFVYVGHGSSEQYFEVCFKWLLLLTLQSKSLERLQSPSALLFGCSSGRLRPNGDFESSGMALNFLAGGSPGWIVLGDDG